MKKDIDGRHTEKALGEIKAARSGMVDRNRLADLDRLIFEMRRDVELLDAEVGKLYAQQADKGKGPNKVRADRDQYRER